MQCPAAALGLGSFRAALAAPRSTSPNRPRPRGPARASAPGTRLISDFRGCLLPPKPARGPRDGPCIALPAPRRGLGAAVAFLELSAPAAAKWVLRLVSFYTLLRLGVAKEVKGGAIDNAQSFVVKQLFGDSDAKRKKEARRAAAKWKESTKGSLVRKLRVPSVSQGRKLLNSIASVLSEDDLFVDVASHKGCQVRRESAHSQSVCCYNVRALFDELPTPHLELEITVFPAGPLTALEYQKAQKLEGVLRKGNSI